MNVRHVIWASIVSTTISCQSVKKEYNSFDEYPVREDALTEMEYSPAETKFSLWAPTAEEVRVLLFESGNEGSASNTFPMEMGENGTWTISIKEDLKGKFYTFNVKVNGKWLGDTPGIMAKAVGVNGKRAAVLDLRSTDPEGWENDVRPPLKNYADIMVYEMHHRDFSLDSVSGIQNKGKFLALTEQGTISSSGEKTGIDHLKELGITHVHLLPSYDYASVDETKLDKAQYNWGYDPQNYNVPDGSYSTDPYKPDVRIREFKQMVQALHKAGIRVVLDVVYNHTFNTDESNFERTVPGYFYRQTKDGQWANGSGCGNETASDRAMMRKYMIESVLHWINEYHIDGFRFDLMALHDTETMNAIRTALNRMPRGEEILVYGEPWKAAASAMQEGYFPSDKQNIGRLMDGISMFCDDTRDSIKGSVFIAAEGGYVNGKERLSAGILSATDGWMDGKGAYEPRNASQLIPYVSAHDNYTLWDKLKLSDPKRKEDAEPDFGKMDERTLSMNRLAAGIVMTCKGMPFFQAGEEFARTKHGEGNSFKSSWQLNKIDWTRALEQEELVDYYRGLLALRRKFQAYGTCEPDCKKTFFRENQIAGYELEYPDGHAVCVFYNPWEKEALQKLPEGNWKLLCDGKRCAEDGAEMKESMMLPAKSMVLLARE